MKQRLIPKPIQKQAIKFHHKKNASLRVLEMNNDELFLYLKEFGDFKIPMMNTTSLDVDADAYLEYEHSSKSLEEAIMEQVHLSKFKLNDDVCEFLLSYVDGNGYVRIPLKELLKESPYTKDVLIQHLSILRTFEPFGCFAFSLSECLKIQCRLIKGEYADDAFILCDCLEDIALGNVEEIIEKTNVSEDKIVGAIAYIKKLYPKPASSYSKNAVVLNPEFIVEVEGEEVLVRLEKTNLFLMALIDDMDENIKVLKQERQKLETFMSFVEKRNITMLQVMQVIVNIQKEFFLHKSDLRPCTLDMVAKECGLHISTISRTIANKSCLFEKKYYALKDFFVRGGSEEHSAIYIKQKMKQYINEEDKTKPYSDEKLKNLLSKEGIEISRRAIAKYRESMYIFNSTKRQKRKES